MNLLPSLMNWLRGVHLWIIAILAFISVLVYECLSGKSVNNMITLITCLGTLAMVFLTYYNSAYDRKMNIAMREYYDFRRSISEITYGHEQGPRALKKLVADFKKELRADNAPNTVVDKTVQIERELEIYSRLRGKCNFYLYSNRLTNLLDYIDTIRNAEIENKIAKYVRSNISGTEKYYLYLEGIYQQTHFNNDEPGRLKRLIEKYHLLCFSQSFPPSKSISVPDKTKTNDCKNGQLFYQKQAFSTKNLP